MAVNSLYPGFVKVFYTANGHDHTMILPVVPQTIPMVIGTQPTLLLNDGSYEAWSTAIPKIVTHLLPLWPSTCTFTRLEIFGMASKTGDPYYVTGMAVAGGAGTDTDPLVAFGMAVATFRTDQGGLYKLYLMESTLAANQELTSPSFGGQSDLAAVINHFIGADGCVRGRDGGEIIGSIKVKTKTSDALRARYL